MYWLAVTSVVIGVLAGWVLALLTLPGVWCMLLIALACQWWQGWGLYSWWTLGICAAVAAAGEVIEVALSAVAARTVGGSRTGAAFSVVGAIVGALVGAPFFPPVGIIVGAVLGAGLAALFAERGIKGQSWSDSGKVAGGAAVGRLAATVVKLTIAGVVGLVLIVGALVPGM